MCVRVTMYAYVSLCFSQKHVLYIKTIIIKNKITHEWKSGMCCNFNVDCLNIGEGNDNRTLQYLI